MSFADATSWYNGGRRGCLPRGPKRLIYMHMNPVNAGLVEKATDWAWSSARFFEEGKPVGVPIQWIF